MTFAITRSAKIIALTTISAAALTACWGDGDGGSTLTVKGVAATGLAIDGGSVSVQCKSGTGTATTQSNGSYIVNVADGVGPCLVTVTKTGQPTLYSITRKDEDGNGVEVANVTPISSAIVQAIATAKGSSIANLISSQAPSNTEINSAVTAVIATINAALTNAGSSITLTADQLLSDPNFTAATSSNTSGGSTLDQALDKLDTAGTLTTLTTTIAATTLPTVTPNPTGSN